MNLNDFVVLPNNKAKSVKLNARNLQELQMETVTLAQESKEIEEQLQQLKESMSKEKEERGLPGGFKWKSGQCGSLSGVKKNKENRFQKLSSGKLKIRVLKDGLVTAPPQPPPPILRDRRKNRLRGTYCGQCEMKTAGLTCAECAEDYCIGCFTKFHQKGALKLHRMIPIQTDLQTHVSTRDVVTCFQKQIDPTSCPMTCAGPVGAKHMQLHPDHSQVLIEDHHEEKKVEVIEEGRKMSFLEGEYNEVESASSFQEALRQWRGEKTDGSAESMSKDAMWTPIGPVSVAVVATQADFSPDKGAVGRGGGGGEEKVPVRVEFRENSLTYMDRLLLKKHRRTPVESDRPLLAFGADLKLLPEANTGEETASGLTAQEEDFRHYCASLFEVPVNRGTTEPESTTPESCLVIEVMDERDGDMKGVLVATDNNRSVPSVQSVFIKEAPVPQTALTTGSSRVRCSSPSPAQCKATARPNAALKPHSSKLQTLHAQHSMKALSSKSKLSARPTPETPRTSKTSITTPNSMSQKQNCPPDVHKSSTEHGSTQHLSSTLLVHLQGEIPKFPLCPDSFPPDVSPLASTRPRIPEDHLSPSPSISLRSTFTVSPSSSTNLGSLPQVYQSTPLQRTSDPSLLQQPQSPQLSPEPISWRLPQLPPNNLESPRQSRHRLPLSPVSSSPDTLSKSMEPSPPVKNKSSSSRLKAVSSHGSTPTSQDPFVCMTSAPIDGGEHEFTLETQSIPSLPSQLLDVIKSLPSRVKMEAEMELSVDSGEEISTDSLGGASHEEDSSDEEAQMHGCLASRRSRDEHSEDPSAPADAQREKDLPTHEKEQLSTPSMVVHDQNAGPGLEQLCDPDGSPPPGLDMNSGHSDGAENTRRDPLLTGHNSPQDPVPTESEGHGPSSGLSAFSEERVVDRTRRNNRMQPTTIQIHSTRPTSRGEMSTSGSRPSPRAAQEVMEVCGVDPSGCEDPDLESDTTAHALRVLEQELRLMDTWKQASLFATGDRAGRDPHGSDHFTRGRAGNKQNDDEEEEEDGDNEEEEEEDGDDEDEEEEEEDGDDEDEEEEEEDGDDEDEEEEEEDGDDEEEDEEDEEAAAQRDRQSVLFLP
ncbi:uncharacterized protein zbbx isoform X2 [Pungitius pungitius]|uniref:uncharacterized protein zbbx isoform X2 n=1 Tax=Pungitius pungitius TaxID=134920 RepID=UPI002E14A439